MDNATAPSEKRLQCGLLIGLLLIFLAVWKGDGGYRDLGEYLNNAENLWLKGDLSRPDQPGHYYIHPLGIAVLSGPFVLAGAVIEKISGGAIGHRDVAAFSIPFFSALACLLLYKIGRLLNLSPLVSLWGALMLGLATPMISFTRLYFGEGGIAFSICLASWAFLHSDRTDGRAGLGWALLAGAGLAGATACHFNNLFISAILWMGMAATFFIYRDRNARIAALSLVPLLAGAALLYMNARRFGGPFLTGYEAQMEAEAQSRSAHAMSLFNVPSNLQYFGVWLLRVPWVLFAMYAMIVLLFRQPFWAMSVVAATLAHLFFFQTFVGLRAFPIRYHQSAVILASIGLLAIGDWLWRRWESRGLIYAGLVMLLWNAGHFIRSTDTPSTQTFWVPPDGGGLNAYVWYMAPQSERSVFGSPMGPLQWTVLIALLASGLAFTAWAIREAARISPAQPEAAAR